MRNFRRGLYGWLGGALVMASGASHAATIESGCRYDHLPQEEVEYLDIRLTSTDSKVRSWRPYVTEDGRLMPAWLLRHDPDRVHAHVREVSDRRARLLHNEYLERNEGRPGATEKVRYYVAHTENCQRLFLRVPVEHAPFSSQLHAMDDRSDGSLSFSLLQNDLDMIIEKDWQMAKKHIGKPVMVIPNQQGGVTLLSHDQRHKAYATPFTWFTVTGVSRHVLSLNEEKLSGFHLLVEDREGSIWRMPWQPERMYLGNPLRQRDVREVFHDAIREGRLEEGMNRTEVALVTGSPIWERRYPIYRDGYGQRRFVIDESYRRDGLRPVNRHLPDLEDSPIGEQRGWFFPDIMGKEDHLRFNEDGLLDMSSQPASARGWLGHDWLKRYHPD